MSRIGKQPIEIPNGVSVVIDGQSIRVEGPKGNLTQEFPKTIELVEEDNQLLINIPEDYTKQQVLRISCYVHLLQFLQLCL